MTFEEFDKFFEEFVDECRSMRDTKGKEYASSVDRFDNFNRLAKTLEIDRLKIASIYLQKHLDAINTYIKTGKVSSTEPIRGRFIDAVTYLKLMAGMAEEVEAKQENSPKPRQVWELQKLYTYKGKTLNVYNCELSFGGVVTLTNVAGNLGLVDYGDERFTVKLSDLSPSIMKP